MVRGTLKPEQIEQKSPIEALQLASAAADSIIVIQSDYLKSHCTLDRVFDQASMSSKDSSEPVSLYTGTKGCAVRILSVESSAAVIGAKRQRILAVSEWSPEEKVDIIDPLVGPRSRKVIPQTTGSSMHDCIYSQ